MSGNLVVTFIAFAVVQTWLRGSCDIKNLFFDWPETCDMFQTCPFWFLWTAVHGPEPSLNEPSGPEPVGSEYDGSEPAACVLSAAAGGRGSTQTT